MLGPDANQGTTQPPGDNYIAMIAQYTERPDLLIDALERNDPGFVKRMNSKTEKRSERMADAKFWFGGVQAYVGLAVSAIAALSTLGFIGYAIYTATAGFWLIIGLAAFYAMSQGGPSGFITIGKGIADLLRKGKSGDD